MLKAQVFKLDSIFSFLLQAEASSNGGFISIEVVNIVALLTGIALPFSFYMFIKRKS